MLRASAPAVLHLRPRVGLGTGILLCIVAVSTITSAGVWRVWQRGRNIKTAYDLAQRHREYRRLVEKNRRLELEMSTIKHPSELTIEAREQLELVPPTAEQRIEVP